MRAPSIYISMYANLADLYINGLCGPGDHESLLADMVKLGKRVTATSQQEMRDISNEIFAWTDRETKYPDKNISIYLGLMDLITFGKSEQLRAYPGDINQIIKDLDIYYDEMTGEEKRLASRIDKRMVDEWYREQSHKE